MFRIKNRSIMFKILVMILAICILESLLFTFMSGKLTEHTLETIITENSMKNAELYSEFIGNWFKERMQEIEVYANTQLLRTMDWNNIEPYLKQEVLENYELFDHFMIADPDGNYHSTLKIDEGNANDRDYFKAAMEGKTIVSNPIISRTGEKSAVIVAAPIIGDNNKIVGVIAGAVNLIKLSQIIDNLKYNYPNAYSYIIDKNGLILAHPNREYILKENIVKKSDSFDEQFVETSKEILAHDKGTSICTLKNITAMNCYYTIANTDGWKLVIKIPVDYWHTPIRYALTRLILIGIAGLIIASILGLIIAKSISTPIIKLKEAFTMAATGDLTVRSAINTDDEIGDAAKSFNKMMDTMSSLTYYDSLTLLPNKMLFNANFDIELKKAACENSRLAIMILDIDKFESINNTLGHSTGDKLLKSLAEKISSLLDHNHIMSRLDGDRFEILIKNFGQKDDIVKLADDVTNVIKHPWVIDKHRFYITACMGIAFYPQDGDSSDSLFKNAFSALQKAKSRGRDNYQLYEPSINARLIEQLNLESNMHHALDNGEFSLYYQPQIDSETQNIIGCEALIRWNHPELGMISPPEFIPISETNGLIIHIGRWVLYTACMQNKLWQNSGCKPIFISVNLSVVQLIQEDFIDMVSDILKETGLSPEYLELEITESVAVKNHEHITVILEKLKKMGIRIALDDFGTGYSSLNYLRNFAVTTLKIDRNFINDINENLKNSAIVSSILTMGHNLMLNVTAEGVETKEQYDILRDRGCDIIQGYYFSKPLPLYEFEKLWL